MTRNEKGPDCFVNEQPSPSELPVILQNIHAYSVRLVTSSRW